MLPLQSDHLPTARSVVGPWHPNSAYKGLRPNQNSWAFLAIGVMGPLQLLPTFLLTTRGIPPTLEHNMNVDFKIVFFKPFNDAVAFVYSPSHHI
jgi:hypothetical protein